MNAYFYKLLALVVGFFLFLFILIMAVFNPEFQFPAAGTKAPLETTTPPPAAFTCPETEWVDCLPGPGPVKAQCQKEYLDWAKKNCPNFRGAAY